MQFAGDITADAPVFEKGEDSMGTTKAKLTTMHYHMQECVLYGSIFSSHRELLEQRLAGLCDPSSANFVEHEMAFSLKTENNPDVCLRLRRRFLGKEDCPERYRDLWHIRYIGGPEPDQKCPTIVRKVIDSVAHSDDMMEFVKTLGLRMNFEFIASGKAFTLGNMKILVYSLKKTDKPGTYLDLKAFGASDIVEMSVCIPEGAEYATAAKQMRILADQLSPLVEMEKVNYFNPSM